MMYSTRNSQLISAFSNPPRPCSKTTATYPPSYKSIPIQARIGFSCSFSSNFIPPLRSLGTHRNPYSRVLEGQHLSMRLAPSSGQIRKSPRNHPVVGDYIRNPALRLLPLEFPTFPQAIVKKENHDDGPLTFF